MAVFLSGSDGVLAHARAVGCDGGGAVSDQSQLAVDPYRSLEPAGDKVQTFELVLFQYERGWLQIPEHQRDPNAWDHKKRKKYVLRLKDSQMGSHPTGFFATYQITGGGPVWLNDGYQRLTTLAQLKAHPAGFGMDDVGVEQLLHQSVSVQHRHFASHDDAMLDFQLINFGTRLTPLELCRGYLAYMDDYRHKWEPVLEQVADAIGQSWHRVQVSSRVTREQEHKLRRHTLSVFYRYLSKEREPRYYRDVSRQDVQELAEQRQVIEWRLREKITALGFNETCKEAQKFCRLIERETALIEQLRNEVLGGGVGLSPVLHRWLLDFSVWCKNTKTPVFQQESFVRRLLEGTGGNSQWHRIKPNGQKKTTTLQLAHMGQLPELANLAGMPELCEPVRRRRRANGLRPGYHDSHIDPFVQHGDGPTVPEAAPSNLARGARSIV